MFGIERKLLFLLRFSKTFFVVAIILIFSSTIFFPKHAYPSEKFADLFYPGARFAVIADPHFYDPELGMEGEAFKDSMVSEIKLFRYGLELLEAAVHGVERANVDFLIITGDLTKDGELSSHLKLADYLADLKDSGIPSFVVPGNHDINNPEAISYPDTGPETTASVSPQDFVRIYNEFGFADSLSRDQHSLSYVVEPAAGLWLLAIDSCRYREQTDAQIDGGRIRPETMAWIKMVLREALLDNKQVVAFMHHAVLENFAGHAELLPDYIVEDHEAVARAFAGSGLELIFTGHTHVQDATAGRFEDGSFLLDIQTGSILTYPHPYRIVSLKNGLVRVNSEYIFEIPGDFGDMTFYEFSRAFMEYSARQYARDFFLPGPIAELFVQAYMAHAVGDEQPCAETLRTISMLKSSPISLFRTAGHYLESVWTDLPPADNDFLILLPGSGQALKKMLIQATRYSIILMLEIKRYVE